MGARGSTDTRMVAGEVVRRAWIQGGFGLAGGKDVGV